MRLPVSDEEWRAVAVSSYPFYDDTICKVVEIRNRAPVIFMKHVNVKKGKITIQMDAIISSILGIGDFINSMIPFLGITS